jgi:hypothetical protein
MEDIKSILEKVFGEHEFMEVYNNPGAMDGYGEHYMTVALNEWFEEEYRKLSNYVESVNKFTYLVEDLLDKHLTTEFGKLATHPDVVSYLTLINKIKEFLPKKE